jgi:Uncharacterized protein conserved in bacteria (DUF2169)
MRLENLTPLPAAIVSNSEPNDEMTALFLACATYDLGEGGATLAAEQRPLVLEADLPVPNDALFGKVGIGVTVTGNVYPSEPGGSRGRAILQVGDGRVAVEAFGPRVWRRGAGDRLTPTAPAPFEAIVMDWKNAYGGGSWEEASVVDVDGEETIVPPHPNLYALNSDGLGHHGSQAAAIDGPLPLLEHPDQLISAWDDRPEPACLAPCPLWTGVRMKAIWDEHAKEADLSRIGRMQHRAGPRCVFDAVPPGTPVRVHGMLPAGEGLSFDVPAPPVFFRARIGARSYRIDPELDAIDIDAAARSARLVYRAILHYPLVRFERRTAQVETSDDFAAKARGAAGAERRA